MTSSKFDYLSSEPDPCNVLRNCPGHVRGVPSGVGEALVDEQEALAGRELVEELEGFVDAHLLYILESLMTLLEFCFTFNSHLNISKLIVKRSKLEP